MIFRTKYRKMFTFLFIFTLLIINIFPSFVSINNVSGKNELKTLNDENYYCYGFIIPIPSGSNTENETFENSKVRHLINDLDSSNSSNVHKSS